MRSNTVASSTARWTWLFLPSPTGRDPARSEEGTRGSYMGCSWTVAGWGGSVQTSYRTCFFASLSCVKGGSSFLQPPSSPCEDPFAQHDGGTYPHETRAPRLEAFLALRLLRWQLRKALHSHGHMISPNGGWISRRSINPSESK